MDKRFTMRLRGSARTVPWRLATVVPALLCSACINSSLPKGPQPDAMMAAAAASAPAPRVVSSERVYLLQPGDTFEVKLFYSPELNDSVIVRPDGKISLQLIGEVQAAGMRPADLEAELRERYAKVLRDPVVAVVVKQYQAQHVFVAGEVRTPGEMVLQDRMTALQAIGHAGFFTADAETRSVAVLRYRGTGGPEFFMLDIKAMIDGQPDAGADVMLQPLDVVFVPQTQIASVADFFSRYVDRIVPLWRNMGFSFQYFVQSARVITPP